MPANIKRIAMPLGPRDAGDSWDDLVAKAPPLEGKPTRDPKDVAMIIDTSGSTRRRRA